MGLLEGAPCFGVIDRPRGDPRLKGFCCGTSERWERFVSEVVERQYVGSAKTAPTIVAMSGPEGELIGLCGFRPMEISFDPPGRRMIKPPYIQVVGLAERYRGWTLKDGRTRLGSALLVGTMRRIAVMLHGDAMPAVWALVSPENLHSHNLFERHGCGLIRKPSGDHRRYRPYGLPIF